MRPPLAPPARSRRTRQTVSAYRRLCRPALSVRFAPGRLPNLPRQDRLPGPSGARRPPASGKRGEAQALGNRSPATARCAVASTRCLLRSVHVSGPADRHDPHRPRGKRTHRPHHRRLLLRSRGDAWRTWDVVEEYVLRRRKPRATHRIVAPPRFCRSAASGKRELAGCRPHASGSVRRRSPSRRFGTQLPPAADGRRHRVERYCGCRACRTGIRGSVPDGPLRRLETELLPRHATGAVPDAGRPRRNE